MPGRFPRRVRWLVAFAVVAAAVTSVAFAATDRSQPVAMAARQPLTRLSPAAASGATHDILFIGASYTRGLGVAPGHGYAPLVGRELGWRTQINGISGTGYLNPGAHGRDTFADRIARMPTRPRPDIVLLQGGRDDIHYPTAQLRAAAITTMLLAQRHFAHAQLVVLGPIPARVPVSAAVLRVNSTLRSAAATCHVPYIDAIAGHWITPGNERGYAGPVPGHPGTAGYEYIAQRTVAALHLVLDRHTD